MALHTVNFPAIPGSAGYSIDLTVDADNARYLPFAFILIDNKSFSSIAFTVDSKFTFTVKARATMQYTAPVRQSIAIQNNTAVPISASAVSVVLTNGERLDTVAGGADESLTLDEIITVTDTAAPVIASGSAKRFVTDYLLTVKSMGALTPGTHKIYTGSGPNTELLNVGSYMTPTIAQGRFIDMNKILCKCDDPFTTNLFPSGTFESDWTGWAMHDAKWSISAVNPIEGLKSAYCDNLGAPPGGWVWMWSNKIAVDNRPLRGSFTFKGIAGTTPGFLFAMRRYDAGLTQLNTDALTIVNGATTPTVYSYTSPAAGSTTVTYDVLIGVVGQAYVDSIKIYKGFNNSDYPTLSLTGGT